MPLQGRMRLERARLQAPAGVWDHRMRTAREAPSCKGANEQWVIAANPGVPVSGPRLGDEAVGEDGPSAYLTRTLRDRWEPRGG